MSQRNGSRGQCDSGASEALVGLAHTFCLFCSISAFVLVGGMPQGCSAACYNLVDPHARVGVTVSLEEGGWSQMAILFVTRRIQQSCARARHEA